MSKDLPTSVSELMILKNLANVMSPNEDIDNETQVQRWLNSDGFDCPDFKTLMQQARREGRFTAPNGSLDRLMGFLGGRAEFERRQYRDVFLNVSLALSRPVALEKVEFIGQAGQQPYSSIEVALSSDGLLRLSYEDTGTSNGKKEKSGLGQVTASLAELGLPVMDYVLSWDELGFIDPKRFGSLKDALGQEAGLEFVARNPSVLALTAPDDKNHALIGFGPDLGSIIIARQDSGKVIAYEEHFDSVIPVRIERPTQAPITQIYGLDTRLGLNIPNPTEESSPSLYFVFKRDNERIELMGNDSDFRLAMLDENEKYPVSPHFYYGIQVGAANAIWQLNRDARSMFQGSLAHGLSVNQATATTVSFIYEQLKSRYRCEEIATAKPDIEKMLNDEPPPAAPGM